MSILYSRNRIVYLHGCCITGTSKKYWIPRMNGFPSGPGVHERRVADPEMAASDLALEASRRALEMAGLKSQTSN